MISLQKHTVFRNKEDFLGKSTTDHCLASMGNACSLFQTAVNHSGTRKGVKGQTFEMQTDQLHSVNMEVNMA